jgi:Sec-independent protein translocase protein TatA
MEIFGIGFLEIVFVILIALIVLGPTDMIKAGRTVGKFLRQLVLSPGYRAVQQASRDLRTLPNKLMREAEFDLDEELRSMRANMADLNAELKETGRDISPWTTPPASQPPKVEPSSGNHQPAPAPEASEDREQG